MLLTSQLAEDADVLFGFMRDQRVLLSRPGDFQAIGRLNKELALLGVVGYNGFCGRTCFIHSVGIGNWINRELLWAAFDYPFNQLKLEYLFGHVAGDNLRALKLNHHLGFSEIQRVKNGWATGVDLVIFGMARAACRFLVR